jgi:hypothetical protein
MPFCRECGKEVEEDWVTCPHCSEAIGPSASNTIGLLQDSVIMGDISINEGKTECVQCESTGVTQIKCSICKEKCFCSVCESEVMNSRSSSISHIYNNQQTDWRVVMGRFCNSCFIEERAKFFDSICTHCKIYFDGTTEKRLTSPRFGSVPNPSHCYNCQKMARLISKWESRMKNPTGNAVPNEYRKYLGEAERKWNEAFDKCNIQ